MTLMNPLVALALLAIVADGPPAGYSIPVVDLAGQADRQVVLDREPGQYLGHPTTVLLEDGRTMLCVYPKGHGRGAIVLKRSEDGGRTWSDRLPTPENWATSKETPTIHRVVDAEGRKRLIVFSGLYPIRMAVSEDDGASWSPLKPIGDYGGIVAMGSVERVGPGRYIALFHDDGRYLHNSGEAGRFVVYQVESEDGGLTWGEPRAIATHPTAHLCEPGLVRSPDGEQLAVLLRENSRRQNSFLITSDDDGRTWSEPRELPGALTGDRHVGKYAPDGRLFLSFRDTTRESPTRGDWVGWVGTYEDLIEGREGQYRVRLMDNTKGADCAYPGVEVLPDGTLVCTTYGHWTEGEPPYIVSVRFTLDELDAMAGGEDDRERLVVLTDITSLEAGVREPDDGQSLIRLMLYANEFEIEGLIATSNLGHGRSVRPDLIHRVIDAFAEVRPNLLLHDPRYPEPGALHAVVKSGQPVAGPEVPVEDSIGPGRATEGSDWLIEVLDRDDPRPVRVIVWGGTADLAQALRDLRQRRGAAGLAPLLDTLWVHTIGEQDSTSRWLRREFPGLRLVRNRLAYRGMYRGGEASLVGSEWVRTHIHAHGALGDLYPDYRGGDIFGRRFGPVRGIKEGDSPSLLALVPNGLNMPDRPDLGGWGGTFVPVEGTAGFVDLPDPEVDRPEDPMPRIETVARWRPDFQADFAARLDWCVAPPGAANHPPTVRLAGPFRRPARPGDSIELDASASTDPDGDALTFAWGVYPEADAAPAIESVGPSKARVEIPDDSAPGTIIPILLTVRDDGTPPLTRYARALIRVEER